MKDAGADIALPVYYPMALMRRFVFRGCEIGNEWNQTGLFTVEKAIGQRFDKCFEVAFKHPLWPSD